MSLGGWLVRALDPMFPPNRDGTMLEGLAITDAQNIKAASTMGTYLEDLGRTDVDIMDFGCGWGGESLWLARRVRSVIGVDLDESSLEVAEQGRLAAGVRNCRFLCGIDAVPSASVDAIFSTDTFEHVMDLDGVFHELHRVLRPAGVLISRWGPLFYSPRGYHLPWASQVPYAHLIGGIKIISELRRERSPKKHVDVDSWQALTLNECVFADYRRAALKAGFELERFERIPVKHTGPLARMPYIGRWFTFGVDARVRKP